MQLLRLILCILSLAAASAAHAGGSGLWLALAVWSSLRPRPVPQVSPYHICIAPMPAPARDSCTFVAGVRHCPRAEPR